MRKNVDFHSDCINMWKIHKVSHHYNDINNTDSSSTWTNQSLPCDNDNVNKRGSKQHVASTPWTMI